MSNFTYGIEYLATQTSYPNKHIFSQKYPQFQVANPDLLHFLSPIPTYSQGFMVYDPNDNDQRNQLTLVTPLHVSYTPNCNDPMNGLLEITDSQIRSMLSHYNLHHNLNTSKGFILKPKSRVILILHIKGKNQILFSSPVKMKYFASWNSDPEVGFDSVVHVDAYRNNLQTNKDAVDPRPIYTGHLYHKLRSEDYIVKRSVEEKTGETTYYYPFDLVNPENRFKVKSLPEYIYDKQNRMFSLDSLREMVKSIPDKILYRYAGIKGNTAETKKYIKLILMPPEKLVKAYKLLSKKPREEWLPTIMKDLPDYPIYGDYEWYNASPLQTTISEMIYEC